MHAFQSGDAFLQILGILFLKIGSLFKVGFKGVFLLDMMEVPTCYIINVYYVVSSPNKNATDVWSQNHRLDLTPRIPVTFFYRFRLGFLVA